LQALASALHNGPSEHILRQLDSLID